MGVLTRSCAWSTQAFSTGSTSGPIIDCGDYISFGVIINTTGAIGGTWGFNVGISQTALSPLISSAGAVISVAFSTSVQQAYNLPAALAPWRYVQPTMASTVATATQFTWVMKG